MGTEVLRPQDCLIERIRVAPAVFHRRKSFYGNGDPRFNNNSYRKQLDRPDQRRRSPDPSISKRSSSSENLRLKPHNNNSQLVMGQVMILRRGESFDSKIAINQGPLKKNGDDLMVCGTGRLGPDPETVPKQIRMNPVTSGCRSDMYAGSAFSLSPSPSSLPLPSFFSKKQGSNSVDDSATRDLRRLLRID